MFSSYLPNILVAISNLSFLYFARQKNIPAIVYSPMIASFIYHLAETKHKLPGIPFLNRYSYQLLNLDRLCAYGAVYLVLSKIYQKPELLTSEFILIGLVGFGALAYSEQDTIVQKLFGKVISVSYLSYTLSHIVWHLSAFKMIADSL